MLAEIKALQAQKVPVIGAVNLYQENSDGFAADYDKRHIMVLYGQMDGVGHNAINKPHGTDEWAFYVPCPKQPWPMAMAVWLAGRQAMCERADDAEHRIPLGLIFPNKPPRPAAGACCRSTSRRQVSSPRSLTPAARRGTAPASPARAAVHGRASIRVATARCAP